MPEGIDYTDDEWTASAGHFPLTPCSQDELLLLHRHWMWANQQREAWDGSFVELIGQLHESAPGIMATKSFGFMFVWYGLLWSLIEACTEERTLDIRGPFRDDMTRIADTLQRCRNAIMHVPRNNDLLDQRIMTLIGDLEAPATIRRIHRGFGRLFLEELTRRPSAGDAPA